MYKHATIAFTLTIAVAFAVALVAKDIDTLIERGDALLAETQKLVADHKANERGHLLANVENELATLDGLVKRLKSLEKNVTNRQQLNPIEEAMLRSENRISEELGFVEDVYKNHAAVGGNKTADELLEFAYATIKLAHTEIAAHVGHGHLEVTELESQLKGLEDLVKTIEKPSTPASQLPRIDQQLVVSERSIRNLIARLQLQH